jgi:hypothetical protein
MRELTNSEWSNQPRERKINERRAELQLQIHSAKTETGTRNSVLAASTGVNDVYLATAYLRIKHGKVKIVWEYKKYRWRNETMIREIFDYIFCANVLRANVNLHLPWFLSNIVTLVKSSINACRLFFLDRNNPGLCVSNTWTRRITITDFKAIQIYRGARDLST